MAKKVLIVDDDANDMTQMTNLLKKEGYEVEGVENGAEAYDKVSKSHFDLVLLDILMPTLSGYDLLRLFREKLNGTLKIIYVSIVPKEKVDLSDVNSFIQKPFSPESFIKSVKDVLN